MLTGMPVKIIRPADYSADDLFNLLKEFDEKHYVMGAGTTGGYDGSGNGYKGLVSGHAYTIIAAKELKNSSGQVVDKMLKMRNPWNSEKYVGEASDSDSAFWT